MPTRPLSLPRASTLALVAGPVLLVLRAVGLVAFELAKADPVVPARSALGVLLVDTDGLASVGQTG